MDNAGLPKTSLETLRTVEFRLGLRGYDVDEVDDYLEKVAVEADALQEQLRQMTDRLRQAAERIALLESSKPAQSAAPASQDVSANESDNVDSLTRTLEMAQRFVDQTKRESEAEAAKVVAAASDEARKLRADAEDRFKADLSRLEGLKSKLTTDVESMARQLESERTRLRSSLSEMIQWIEDNVQPGAAIMALRQPNAETDVEVVEAADTPASPPTGFDGRPMDGDERNLRP